jgi:N-carbamoylputrescine amidase
MSFPNELQSQEIVDRVVEMAREKELIIIVGTIEPSQEDRPYISQIVAGPDGLLGLYRKTHLSPQEKKWYLAGEKIDVFRYDDISFGVQLCYEAHFPEISTVMALKGGDIIFLPHASPRGSPPEKLESWTRHLKARAFDNGLFVVACNQVGKSRMGLSFPGVSLVLGPDGKLLNRYAGEAERLLVADLKKEALHSIRDHKMKYFLPRRRPELYEAILNN